MLDYRMETFLTLCDTMNYHAAAEKLCMTQPAVTQHIRALEQHYGCRLLHWDGRRLTLTHQGETLRTHAVAERQREHRLRAELTQPKEVRLRIGATKTIGEFVLADQLSRCLTDPARTVSLQVDNTAEVLARLERGEIDFALVEGSFDKARYAHRLYRQEPFVGVCGRTHPFAGQVVAADRLWDEHLLLREEGSGTRRILERQLEVHGHAAADFARVTELGNFGLMARLLARGGCITFAYAAVAADNPALGTFGVQGWELFRAFSYVWLPESGAESAVAEFDACR